MSNKISYIKNENGEIISPVTSVDSIYNATGGGCKIIFLI